MALLTRQQLRDFWNTNINTNGVQSITGQAMNTGGIDVIDSVVLTTEAEDYQWFNDTDPTSIGTPAAGTYFQGVFNEKRWMKTDDGSIIYSASGLWTIFDSTDTVITTTNDYLGNLLRWTGIENGTITLDNSVTNYPEGWHFAIYNNTPGFSILIEPGGTDVIRSYNNNFYIPAYSYATIGLIFVNGVTEWYADIQQDVKNGLGSIAESVPNRGIALTANVWTELVMGTPVYGTLKNVSDTSTTPGRLVINYPDHGVNSVNINFNSHVSMEIPGSDQKLDLAFGVNGVVDPSAAVLNQSAVSGANQTAGMYWPFSFSINGLAKNGDELSLFIRLDDNDTVTVATANFQIQTEALQGVNFE